jgi:hypothetical protein
MWVKAGEREKSKEKCTNGVMFLTDWDFNVLGNLRGLLECGVQVIIDAIELIYEGVELLIGHTSAIGTALWLEIGESRSQVCDSQSPNHCWFRF